MIIRAKARSLVLPTLTLIGFLLAWEFCSRVGIISTTFFPPPTKILDSFLKLTRSGELVSAAGATLFRFFIGLICGSFVGAILGLLMGWYPRLNAFFSPIISAIYPIPKIAIFPLLMVVFGIGEGSKFVAIFLGTFFPMLVTTLTGVRQINKIYFEVGKNYGVWGNNVFTHILVPGSLPSILAGLRLATKVGVLLWFGWQTFRVSELYAVLVLIAFLGIVLNYLVDHMTYVLIPWMGEN
jgi:NitT/TauT family transport system permease protein